MDFYAELLSFLNNLLGNYENKELFLYIILFIWGFSESLINPIPVDLAIVVLIKEYNLNWFYVFIISLLSNIIGASVSYHIGKKITKLNYFQRLIKNKRVNLMYEAFKKNSTLILFLSTFAPLPYKLFTYTSGLVKMNFLSFLIYSLIGRGSRFFLVAFIASSLTWLEIFYLLLILIPAYFLIEHLINRKIVK